MLDMTTSYLGLRLRNPLVAAASPLSKKIETAQALADAGAAAIVMYSLFEEQISHECFELDHYLESGAHSYAESLSYFPDLGQYNLGPPEHLKRLRRLKRAVDIPIIASLNGVSSGGWIEYAQRLQDAGADALELNVYFVPTDPEITSAQLEESYLTLVRDIRAEVSIPLAVKVSPYFSALPNFALRLTEAGVNGLVLFNRFYQPDFDLETLRVTPNLDFSTSRDLRLPLRWIAILAGRIPVDFALTSGVHTGQDAIKAMLGGAKVAMLASVLLRHGPSYLAHILAEMETWLREQGYHSIEELQGSMSQRTVGDPAAFERANYMKALTSFDQQV